MLWCAKEVRAGNQEAQLRTQPQLVPRTRAPSRQPRPQRSTACCAEPRDVVQRVASAAIAACVAVCLSASEATLSPAPSTASDLYSGADPAEQTVPTQRGRSAALSNVAYDDMAMHAGDESLFTEDAWLGMQQLLEYGRYVDVIEHLEYRPGCEMCQENRKILEQAWQVVANEYYDPFGHFSQTQWAGQLKATLKNHKGMLRTKRELYSAAQEMVASLGDRYSEFMGPAQFRAAIRRPTKAELDYLSTQAIGVGMKLGDVKLGDGRVVLTTFAGSSAEGAGVKAGDVVMSLDGMPAAQFSPSDLEAYFRGPMFSTMDVEVAHARAGGYDKARESLTLTRLSLPQQAAVHKVITNPDDPMQAAQYIRINYFSSDATRTVQRAIIEGEMLGVDGYIIDLRNNPGGVFEEAIAIACYFLDAADANTHIVETVRNTDALLHRDVVDESWIVGKLPLSIFPQVAWGLTARPTALITNRATASSSEVLAGALQDNQRAVILGEKTFGKGVIQYYFKMNDGSGLKLTIAKYLTPNYHDVALEGGIAPNLLCSDFPRGLLPDAGQRPDACITSAMKYVASQPLVGVPVLEARR